MKHQAPKTNFQKGVESLLNSPYSPLTPEGKQRLNEQPVHKTIQEASQGKTKKKNEEKERQKARMAILESK